MSLANEPNLSGRLRRRPATLGRAWGRAARTLGTTHPGITVLPADLGSRRGVGSYARRVERAAHAPVPVWGLNDYADTNNQTTTQVDRLLRAIGGQVWLTETGGLYRRKKASERNNPFKAQRHHASSDRRRLAFQTSATSWLVDHLAHADPRITRVYVYQVQGHARRRWRPGSLSGSWDSGLLDPLGNARPSLAVLANGLH